MSQTTPNAPIILDSTGQAIVAQLQRIAGGGGGGSVSAPEYDATTARYNYNAAYIYGDYCSYQGKTYRCKVYSITAADPEPAFDSTKWDEISDIFDEVTHKPGWVTDKNKRSEIFNDFMYNTSTGNYSHAEGSNSAASADHTHAEGYHATASAAQAHAEGYYCTASGANSHAEGYYASAVGTNSHVEGCNCESLVSANSSHAEGYYTHARSAYAHAEGSNTNANGYQSHAEGSGTTATGSSSHAEGNSTETIGSDSHAEGTYTKARGSSSHSEGYSCEANNSCCHAEGNNTKANGYAAHAQGYGTKADGYCAHASGNYSEANCGSSHALGDNLHVNCQYETVVGTYNEEHYDGSNLYEYSSSGMSYTSGNKVKYNNDGNVYQCNTAIEAPAGEFDNSKWDIIGTIETNYPLFEVGNGNYNQRSNAFEVLKDGTAKLNGNPVLAPAPPSVDGTYVLKATVASGVVTYSWVQEV